MIQSNRSGWVCTAMAGVLALGVGCAGPGPGRMAAEADLDPAAALAHRVATGQVESIAFAGFGQGESAEVVVGLQGSVLGAGDSLGERVFVTVPWFEAQARARGQDVRREMLDLVTADVAAGLD